MIREEISRETWGNLPPGRRVTPGVARRRRHVVAAVALAIIAPAASQARQPPAAAPKAKDAFAQLTQLVGRWRPADRHESPLRIHFYLTADDTVLVESWERAGQPHSLTLYHRDGPALLATHYCPQGNQPRMTLVGRDADGLHFAFRDATDLDPAESHQHDLWLDLRDPRRPVRSEVYHAKGAPQPPDKLTLVPAD